MHHSHTPHYDLRRRAHQAMIDEGFEPDFQPEAQRQLQNIQTEAEPSDSGLRDLTALLWSSIDNRESRDLDQVEVAERLEDGTIRVLVGIADVDALVAKATPIDAHAARNTTTVYTGVENFSMLPEALSTDRTSLLEAETREAIVIEMVVREDGRLASRTAYRGLLRNVAQMNYEEVGAWFEGHGPMPPDVQTVAGLEAQLRLQLEAAQRLHAYRLRQGALEFESVEARPIMKDNQVVGLEVPRKNLARMLIENFMISANTALAEMLAETGRPSIQRVVRSPERWSRIVALAERSGDHLPDTPDPRALSAFLARRKAADPARFPDLSLSVVKLLGPGEYAVVTKGGETHGHFGLAATSYTHSTAPNRRFADLVTQRLLKAVVAKAEPPYGEAELEAIAARCTERENAARKVERLMRKVAAALLFSQRIGDTFEAIVTGVSNKGTFVRTLEPPVEGRVMRHTEGLDVGDRALVRLIATDVEHGFIDFECLRELERPSSEP